MTAIHHVQMLRLKKSMHHLQFFKIHSGRGLQYVTSQGDLAITDNHKPNVTCHRLTLTPYTTRWPARGNA